MGLCSSGVLVERGYVQVAFCLVTEHILSVNSDGKGLKFHAYCLNL